MSHYRGDRGRGRGPSPSSRGTDRGRGGTDRGRGGSRGRGVGRDAGGIFLQGQPAVVDARVADNSDQTLVSSLQNLKLNPNELPHRPGFGTIGTQIKLRSNFFPVSFNPNRPFYEYNVVIHPATGTAIRRVKRRIFQLAEQSPDWANFGLRGVVAHDYSAKIIASKQLQQPLVVKVQFYDDDESGPRADGKEYTLTIEFIQSIDTSALLKHLQGQAQYREYDVMPNLSAFNLIVAAFANRVNGGGVMVGRNRYFFPAADSFNLGGGLEAWKGFYSSVRPAHKQLMVNVNVCTTAFYKPGNLADAMIEFKNASFGARPAAFVKGVRVKTSHLERRKTVKGMSNQSSRQYKFFVEDFKEEVTVEQYFWKKYKIKLRYPDAPLVDVGGPKQNLMPPELCEILPNQAFKGKLTDEHTANMIQFAAKPPNINALAISTRGLEDLGFRAGVSPQLAAFGVSIGNNMSVVPARILPAPKIQYGAGTPVVDERASWNLRNVKFAKGAKLENWAVLVIRDGNDQAEFSNPKDSEFVAVYRGFAQMCRTSGMTVEQKDPEVVAVRLSRKSDDDPTRGRAIAEIEKTLKTLTKKPFIILVLLSSGDKHVYSGLKYLCDVVLDVATVCVHSAKIRKERGQPQYFANVALKFNTKLGGVNHALDAASMAWLRRLPTMLVGIDVTHPGPGSAKGTPSIAAVVANSDLDFAQYPASMEIQESRKEMVSNLDKMMISRLESFKVKSGRLPVRVLIYRDGVSEGQFMAVVNEELPLVKQAFRKFDTAQKPYTPALTIVICGKRHHTRFYPTEDAHADSNGNPRPGTVVDRGVTAIYHFDFFLQAHGGLQGTTRPTHYYVVHDEIGFKADELQVLTNSVSYMFARATKAVSLVSPAYYADLACERGRCYLHKLLHGISPPNATEEAVYKIASDMWRQGVNGKNLKDTMFYL